MPCTTTTRRQGITIWPSCERPVWFLPALLEDLVPNGGQFAFENSSLADTLAPYMMLLPQPPLCPVYTGANPLDDWDTADQEAPAGGAGFQSPGLRGL